MIVKPDGKIEKVKGADLSIAEISFRIAEIDKVLARKGVTDLVEERDALFSLFMQKFGAVWLSAVDARKAAKGGAEDDLARPS